VRERQWSGSDFILAIAVCYLDVRGLSGILKDQDYTDTASAIALQQLMTLHPGRETPPETGHLRRLAAMAADFQFGGSGLAGRWVRWNGIPERALMAGFPEQISGGPGHALRSSARS
jgi:hypothetical protein